MSSAACHAKCNQHRHVCGNGKDLGVKGCTSCDKVCHENNLDARCAFYRRERGQVRWSTTPQQRLDTQSGTGGAIPHMSQIAWEFTGGARDELLVDGVAYKAGKGDQGDSSQGEMNNCLIDSLRQCLGQMVCDRKKVREDLVREFGHASGSDRRRRVTYASYLDIDCHWKAILQSLFRHNRSNYPTSCDLSKFCIVALDGYRPGHGVVLGDKDAVNRLVIINWGDVHFDPCHRV